MAGTILLTAGTGKTSQRMIPLLQESKIPFILTSRNPPKDSRLPYVRFEMLDNTTWLSAFDTTPAVSAIYLIAPEGTNNPVTPLKDFITYALKSHGVKRFIMMTGSSVTKGGYYVGGVWSFLDQLQAKPEGKGLEYAFVKATWFTENFSEREHRTSIREEGKFYSAAGEGKVPFVACSDIAHMAFVLLTCSSDSPLLQEESYRALGPELLTHDEAAGILEQGLGRDVRHVDLSAEDGAIVKHYEGIGMPVERAQLMGMLHKMTKGGAEEKIFEEGAVEKVTGLKPMGLREWVEENKGAFD